MVGDNRVIHGPEQFHQSLKMIFVPVTGSKAPGLAAAIDKIDVLYE